MMSAEICPGSITPGHQAIAGTRIPPSIIARRHVLTLDKHTSTSRFARLFRSDRRISWLAEAGCPICRRSAIQPFDTGLHCFIAAVVPKLDHVVTFSEKLRSQRSGHRAKTADSPRLVKSQDMTSFTLIAVTILTRCAAAPGSPPGRSAPAAGGTGP